MTLVSDVRAALRTNADPERATNMRSYMKSSMPFRGVSAPVQRALYRDLLKKHAPSCEERLEAARRLFFEAQYREERYAAILISDRRQCQSFELLPLFERMIVEGAWWDIVDWIASHHLGDILAKEPKKTSRVMKKWAKDPHLWKRRSAIICQIRRKEETDLDLLYACIEPNLGDPDFFIRKAIGWAFRSYAWTAPKEVARYVKENRDRLSNLSVREALKNAGGGGRGASPRRPRAR